VSDVLTPTPADNLPCPQCGYDLRAIDESDRCPECGWEIDRTGLARSRIPWSMRGRALGRFRAYWRTVWLGAWRVGRLAEEIGRPVELCDAKRFATITALLAACPYAISCIAAVIAEGGTGFLNPADLTTPSSSSSGPSRSLLPLHPALSDLAPDQAQQKEQHEARENCDERPPSGHAAILPPEV
jgi:hypothetical protein